MTKFSYFLGSEQWQPEELLEHAQLARKAGFDMVTISEHFHPWVDDHSASNFTWSTLGALARELKNMDLGITGEEEEARQEKQLVELLLEV